MSDRLLAVLNMKRPTYRDWINAAKNHLYSEDPFEVAGELVDEPMFESVTARAEILHQIKLIDQAALDDLIQSLQRLIDQRDQQGDPYPRARLNLGVTYAATGNLNKGAEALDRAVSLYSDVSTMKRENARDPLNARALYYYGQAIRAMVERETLGKAQEVLTLYLTRGAPLGHEDEVREFLGSRKKVPEGIR